MAGPQQPAQPDVKLPDPKPLTITLTSASNDNGAVEEVTFQHVMGAQIGPSGVNIVNGDGESIAYYPLHRVLAMVSHERDVPPVPPAEEPLITPASALIAFPGGRR